MGGADDDVAIGYGRGEAGEDLAAVENIARAVGKGTRFRRIPCPGIDQGQLAYTRGFEHAGRSADIAGRRWLDEHDADVVERIHAVCQTKPRKTPSANAHRR